MGGMATSTLLPAQQRRADARNLNVVNKLKRYLANAEASGRFPQRCEELRTMIAARLVGRCRECHRVLTDPDSVAAGIGPECATKSTQ